MNTLSYTLRVQCVYKKHIHLNIYTHMRRIYNNIDTHYVRKHQWWCISEKTMPIICQHAGISICSLAQILLQGQPTTLNQASDEDILTLILKCINLFYFLQLAIAKHYARLGRKRSKWESMTPFCVATKPCFFFLSEIRVLYGATKRLSHWRFYVFNS